MNGIKVGDKVVFNYKSKTWPISLGKDYEVLEIDSFIISIVQDDGIIDGYSYTYLDKVTEPSDLSVPDVVATAWKIGDVEFILEPNNKVYIIGNVEINIDVDTLKKILTTLDNR